MKNSIYILIVLTLTFYSCNRLKDEGLDIAKKAEQKINGKSKDLLDKVFPFFDAYTPDTKFNKKRFVEYLGVELTEDVRDIYCYGDFLGIDYKVMFSFTCDSATVQRIVAEKEMELSGERDLDLHFAEEFPWWNKEKIKSLQRYKFGEEYKFWEYLWYDKANKKAYFEVYSL